MASDAHIRTSQEERDGVVEALREHAGAGRLEMSELEERVERALAARTRGELDALRSDLPRTRRSRPSRPRAGRRVAISAAAWLPVTGLAVLLIAPPAFAWVGWTALGWWLFAGLPSRGLGFFACSSRKRRRRAAPV